MTLELNLLVLRARDIAALVRFYAALGIEFNKEQHGSGPEHYSGKAGAVLLEIYPIGSGAATTAIRLGFTVSSISTSIAAAVAAGGTIVSPPQDSSWGSRAVLMDPEGHKVELLQMSGIEEPFIAAVRAYCEWVDSEPRASGEEERLALRLLSRLYCEALLLPTGDCGEDTSGQRISDEEWMRKHRRFASMSFQYYQDYFEPTDLGESPTMGDVADDLADIYRDLADALSLYDAGHIVEALWEFRNSFRTHWGRHAVGAINAIHRYIADNYD